MEKRKMGLRVGMEVGTEHGVRGGVGARKAGGVEMLDQGVNNEYSSLRRASADG